MDTVPWHYAHPYFVNSAELFPRREKYICFCVSKHKHWSLPWGAVSLPYPSVLAWCWSSRYVHPQAQVLDSQLSPRGVQLGNPRVDGCSGYGNAVGHISKVLKGEVLDANWSELHNSQELKWNESLVDQRDVLHFFSLLSFPEVFEEAWKLLAAFGKDETSWLGHAPRARYYSPLVNVHPRNPQPSGVDSGWPSRWVSQVQTRAGQIGLCTVTWNQFGYVRHGVQMQYQGLQISSC